MSEYVLPEDILAERAILSGMAQSEKVYFNAVTSLTQNMFYNTGHQGIFKALKEHGKPDLFILDSSSKKMDTEGDIYIGTIFLRVLLTRL